MQMDIYTTTEGLELLGSALEDLGHPSFTVTDAVDFENFLNGKYGAWDYVDESLMKLREVETTITLYIENNVYAKEKLCAINEMLAELKASDPTGKMGRLECSVSNIEDENWATAWKKHYQPVVIGEKLLVCPPWEECSPEGRIILQIDPGMAFGTGIDETTRLCLEVLENTITEGCSVLDVGCGSGILAIGALLLGASSALGIDVLQVAVRSAEENAERNGVADRSAFICGNLADSVKETYDVVCANISADVILALLPNAPNLLKPGGRLILSGIIKDREKDIVEAVQSVGLSFLECREERGWVCIVARSAH